LARPSANTPASRTSTSSLTKTKAHDILGQCQDQGVSISALGYYPNMLDPNPEVSRVAVSHFKKVIAAAPKLGLKLVTGFVGRDWTKTVDENWPRFLKIWKPIIQIRRRPRREDRHRKLPHVLHPRRMARRQKPPHHARHLARAFNDIDSPNFGLNYDPSHFILQGMDPLSPLAEFKSKLFHLHAKDVKINHAALNEVGRFDFPLKWHQPRIPGYGDINWPQFMAELMRIGYDGPLCIEVEDDTFGKTLEGRMKALKVARNVLAPFFGRPSRSFVRRTGPCHLAHRANRRFSFCLLGKRWFDD
jgi:sugar phosphate isomerase/epimerase